VGHLQRIFTVIYFYYLLIFHVENDTVNIRCIALFLLWQTDIQLIIRFERATISGMRHGI
jgi:hypothetical protein